LQLTYKIIVIKNLQTNLKVIELQAAEKEAENDSVSVRKQGEGDKGSMKIEEFVNFINSEIKKEIEL